jgi:acyl-CoA dehydrogenase
MAPETLSQQQRNQVLQPGHRQSKNFFESDQILRAYLLDKLSPDAQAYAMPLLEKLGEQAATVMDALSLTADKNPPQLVKRDKWGETINAVEFHPAYWELMKIAVESQMMRIKWEPSLRQKFQGQRHKLGFSLGLLYGMSESGQYCPLCMTDGVAHLIDRFATEADKGRLLPHIYTTDPQDFYTGAMFLTEKAGGSDVGANTVQARELGNGLYGLYGEKWFCSNVNAQIIFALARTQEEVQGTKGLSIFLVERTLENGDPNPIDIVRLKDKLGTRSMASGECLLNGTVGKLVGPEFQGFRVMTEMINLSRVYNSVAALAGGRRALVEAWQFLSFRVTFGKLALEHALVRAKFWELSALHLANFHLVWRAVDAMDRAEAGDKDEAELLRALTPMVKRDSAEMAVYLCRESMELMGGMGYIEDTVIPKTMRDAMVLPIWEGAGNIMVLDMLRVLAKGQGFGLILKEIQTLVAGEGYYAEVLSHHCRVIHSRFAALQDCSQDEMEFLAKPIFLDLTRLYQCALLVEAGRNDTSGRYELAVEWLMADWAKLDSARSAAPDVTELGSLIGWEF